MNEFKMDCETGLHDELWEQVKRKEQMLKERLIPEILEEEEFIF